MLRTVSTLALAPMLLGGAVLASLLAPTPAQAQSTSVQTQSTLERVLSQLGTNGGVSGIAANVADNVADLRVDLTGGGGGGGPLTLADADPDTVIAVVYLWNNVTNTPIESHVLTVADLGTTLSYGDGLYMPDFELSPEGYISLLTNEGAEVGFVLYEPDGTTLIGTPVPFESQTLSAPILDGDEVVYTDGLDYYLLPASIGDAEDELTAVVSEGGSVIGDVLASASIDGSISNIVTGLDQVQASVMGSVTAVDIPTVNFGNMATTVLGAVNTGEIGLGANQVVEEAIAGTTEAIRSEIQQIGTIPGLTQVALNSALNTMDINGSITNRLTGVNGSVAAVSPEVMDIAMNATGALSLSGVSDLLGSMETTVLGAVNTGTIVSGVNTQISGTVAGIVGNSATNMFGG